MNGKTRQLSNKFLAAAVVFLGMLCALLYIDRKNSIGNSELILTIGGIDLGIIVFILLIRFLKQKRYLNSSLSKIDKMSGIEFEQFLKEHFKAQGYSVTLTPDTGDYGADLVLRRGKEMTLVQAKKRYSDHVGIKSVQEVYGAKRVYAKKYSVKEENIYCMVVTNSFFTKAAKELGEANDVELWDRDRIQTEFGVRS